SLETGYLSESGGNDREGERDVRAAYAELMLPFVGRDNAFLGVQRLEVNVSGRWDDYSDFGTTANPKLGVVWSPAERLHVRGTYSEFFAPPPLGRTGDLRRTAAVLPFS